MNANAFLIGEALLWLADALTVVAIGLPILGLIITVVLLLSPGLLARCSRVQIRLPGRRDSREYGQPGGRVASSALAVSSSKTVSTIFMPVPNAE